ncbi:glutaminase [Desulfohalotomaculum tongense]|uniref:glutaminase A n=1 Tax=Desulforadius tongensis TaxID=1216062 RepID=UPI00195AB8A1|nr:glutaminase A [Desulforadius tongensis]MBM7855410.1 glutaminase [Desulforadius tongensis]
MEELLQKILEQNRYRVKYGRVASYIPALAKADPGNVGISVANMKGQLFTAGDCCVKFTMQSIAKPLALIQALVDRGPVEVFRKVGMEPTGDPFNSIIKLETLNPSKPLNPMINAGAIAITSLIKGKNSSERIERILKLVRLMAGNESIGINEKVYRSEKETAHRNRAMAYFMLDTGVLDGDVEDILDTYFLQCAIEVTCSDIANIALCLANRGSTPAGREIVPAEIVRIITTFMVTCGMYNASGEFAIKAGIPAKSGVSGGIMAVVPQKMGIGVYSPALDPKGNSTAGIHILEDLSAWLDLSIF